MKYCYVEYAYMYPFNGGKSNKSHLKMKLLIKIPAILKKNVDISYNAWYCCKK